jgi:type II secretory pathway pseudopilin PulG
MGRALPAPAAFTLVEVLITSAVIVVVGATALYALTMINGYAAASRVQAAAQCIVQNQIDQILTTGPYVPTNTPADIPAILATGTTSNNIAVFTDPETSAAQVTGTLTTDIRDSGAVSSGTPLYVLRAAVKLRYNFRGKAFQIAMNTLRAPDQ